MVRQFLLSYSGEPGAGLNHRPPAEKRVLYPCSPTGIRQRFNSILVHGDEFGAKDVTCSTN